MKKQLLELMGSNSRATIYRETISGLRNKKFAIKNQKLINSLVYSFAKRECGTDGGGDAPGNADYNSSRLFAYS